MRERHWLTNIRESQGVSRCAVANSADITPSYYGYIEKGVRRPSPETAMRIASVLGFSDTWYRLLEQ